MYLIDIRSADAVGPAGPTGIDQPTRHVLRHDLFAQQAGVDRRVPRHERRPEDTWENVALGLVAEALLGPRHFGRVALTRK